jgi:hypothetical protein
VIHAPQPLVGLAQAIETLAALAFVDGRAQLRRLEEVASVRPTGTGERIQLEQPEMVGILGLQ